MSDSSSTTEAISNLEDHLGYWLRLASNQVSGGFARALQARQVSVAEWVALRHIRSRPGLTPGELAERIGMTRGAVSKILDKLEGKGWAVSAQNPDDSRVQWLSLAPAGESILPELAEIADSNDSHFFGGLSAAEQAELKSLLQKLAHLHGWKESPVE